MADRETVWIVHRAGRDGFGDPLPNEAPDTRVDGCLFAPGVSTEHLDGANQVVSYATVYAPAGTLVRDRDQVRARGELHEVDGKPQDWGSDGVVIQLRLATG